MKLVLIGFGVVGQGLAEILRDKASDLADHNFHPQIVGVATRTRGSLYHADGLSIDDLLTAVETGHFDHYPTVEGLQRNLDPLELTRTSNADTLVETTYSNFEDAQPALDYFRAALETGKHVVTANKGPIALAYAELSESARKAERLIRFESTVMAGTPSLRLGMQALAGSRIYEARGIFNGTTNYILTQMESGKTYADALAQAQKLGYAEADPTADVDGWDAAAKAVILSTVLFNKPLTLDEMTVKGISHITPDDITAAKKAGERWKLIAQVNREGGSVAPIRIPVSNPLAGVSGAMNAITYVTDLLGEVTLVGAGAGRHQTGFGLLADLLDIHRATSNRMNAQ